MALAEGRCSREFIPCRVPDLAAWNLWVAHCLVLDGMAKEFSLTWRLPDKAIGSYIPAKYLARGVGNLGSLRDGTAPLGEAPRVPCQLVGEENPQTAGTGVRMTPASGGA